MKKIVLLVIIFISINVPLLAVENFDSSQFVEIVKEYGSEILPELSNENWINDILLGKVDMSAQSILNRLLSFFLSEFKSNISILIEIIGIAFLCSILKNIQSSFGGDVSEVAFYVCYMLIIVLIITSFTNITNICIKSIKKLSGFMNLLIPVLITLLVSMGSISTVATLQPVILTMISIISGLISNLIIPVILISTILNLISNISSQISVEKISKFLKKSAMYVVEISMIIFAGLISIEGSLSANVDGITAKVAKTAVSNVVPVVGKLISDATDSVIGGISITKNAVGIVGILVITIIVIEPIVKSFVLMSLFNLSSAICDCIADSRISKCMEGVADSIKLIFGIMVMVLFLFIIAITLMIKMSNFSIMIR